MSSRLTLHHPHPWNVSVADAREIQRNLSPHVSLIDALSVDDVRLVAGVDNGYVKFDTGFTAYGAATLCQFPSMDHRETVFADRPADFPYVPGFLTFREGPVMLDALLKLDSVPDVILVDGHGVAHPRRFGIAAHLGVILDHPTIGCAKSVLTGTYEEPANTLGAYTPLIHKNEVIGSVVRTRVGHSPLFVSPGHKLSQETALAIVLNCCQDNGYLPIPTQSAHNAVADYTKPLRKPRTRR